MLVRITGYVIVIGLAFASLCHAQTTCANYTPLSESVGFNLSGSNNTTEVITYPDGSTQTYTSSIPVSESALSPSQLVSSSGIDAKIFTVCNGQSQFQGVASGSVPLGLLQLTLQVSVSLASMNATLHGSLSTGGQACNLGETLTRDYDYQYAITTGTMSVTQHFVGVCSGVDLSSGIKFVSTSDESESGSGAWPVENLPVLSGCGAITIRGSVPTSIFSDVLNPGDYVDAVVILHSSKPNANASGKFLHVSTSAGDQEFFVPVFEQWTPVHFDIKQQGEQVIAALVGPDGQDSADLEYCVNRPKLFSNSFKASMETLATPLLNKGPVSCEPGPAPCDIPDLITFLNVLLGESLNYLAGDPLDWNYTALAQPQSPELPLVQVESGITQQQADAANALAVRLEELIGLSRALYASLNRAETARVVGDTVWAERQFQAGRKYLFTLGRSLQDIGSFSVALGSTLDSTFNVMPGSVLSFEQSLINNGTLPPATVQRLQTAGSNSQQVDSIWRVSIVRDVTASSGSFTESLTDGTFLAAASRLSELAQGDVNGDGQIDCSDLALVKASFGLRQGQAGFDPRTDINGDGVTDILDLAAVAQQQRASCH